MAKIVIFLAIALIGFACVNATEDPFKCYTCTSCETYEDKQLGTCNEGIKGCFIRGNPEDEKWERGCEKDKATACAKEDSDTYACTFCDESECNSGSFVTASIVMTVCAAAILKMLH